MCSLHYHLIAAFYAALPTSIIHGTLIKLIFWLFSFTAFIFYEPKTGESEDGMTNYLNIYQLAHVRSTASLFTSEISITCINPLISGLL